MKHQNPKGFTIRELKKHLSMLQIKQLNRTHGLYLVEDVLKFFILNVL